LEEKPEGEMRRRTYKAVFGDSPLRCNFVITSEGKIAGVGINQL
jgi:hypothetical protein